MACAFVVIVFQLGMVKTSRPHLTEKRLHILLSTPGPACSVIAAIPAVVASTPLLSLAKGFCSDPKIPSYLLLIIHVNDTAISRAGDKIHLFACHSPCFFGMLTSGREFHERLRMKFSNRYRVLWNSLPTLWSSRCILALVIPTGASIPGQMWPV
jgi:hypothetical protein